MMKLSFLWNLGISLIVFQLLSGCYNQLEKVYEPTIVGTPPYNAFIGLTRLDNGEIRHYNYGEGNKQGKSFYLRSLDDGFNWDTVQVKDKWIGADVKSPVTGEYIRLETGEKGVIAVRSKGGIDGDWTKTQVYEAQEDEGTYIMLKPPVFIREGKRILVGAHSTARFGCGVFYSDDDGISWKRSQFVQSPHHQVGGVHKGRRWNHGAVEPTVIEMHDGRIWMIARTAQDEHYESFSEDGGETWSELAPSSFYGTITMPTMNRLNDERLLFIWNNTTPLPEKEGMDGVWEDVFTNRDVLHAAISEDDGKTWKGFRELILNPKRNEPNYGEANQSLSLDMSVHQTQSVELPGGKVLVSLGQHAQHRKMMIFDPNWLNETTREDDFLQGLDQWSTFLYKKGIVGHCAYNREDGARLVSDPEEPAKQVLKIAKRENNDLEISNQGATWNFPTLQKGRFKTSVYIPQGSLGGRISLTDRWFNPSDTTAYKFAMYNFGIEGLQKNKWHTLYFDYDLTTKKKNCRVTNDKGKEIATLPLNHKNIHGLSYVHFISTAQQEDLKGFLVGSVKSSAK